MNGIKKHRALNFWWAFSVIKSLLSFKHNFIVIRYRGFRCRLFFFSSPRFLIIFQRIFQERQSKKKTIYQEEKKFHFRFFCYRFSNFKRHKIQYAEKMWKGFSFLPSFSLSLTFFLILHNKNLPFSYWISMIYSS